MAARGVHKALTEEIISPREIAAKGVFEVLTEEIISRGESPPVESLWVERRSRTGRAVVRGKVFIDSMWRNNI